MAAAPPAAPPLQPPQPHHPISSLSTTSPADSVAASLQPSMYSCSHLGQSSTVCASLKATQICHAGHCHRPPVTLLALLRIELLLPSDHPCTLATILCALPRLHQHCDGSSISSTSSGSKRDHHQQILICWNKNDQTRVTAPATAPTAAAAKGKLAYQDLKRHSKNTASIIDLRRIEQACGCSTVRGGGRLKVRAHLCRWHSGGECLPPRPRTRHLHAGLALQRKPPSSSD